ncbi:MAG: S9 family peptidase [Melioribacteraceae bacterium]|nr:S9 family peptidase [Melioribacteraceae bacterium]MCF8354181.1 S9 family peptidase [Melioribacteraceae bacterium]MCF8394719.1 S9 family peptidase [Melioribacteraceae bacterium]MCF8418104.1 S9 family peptidase [Melioribacteraceae bacterium]
MKRNFINLTIILIILFSLSPYNSFVNAQSDPIIIKEALAVKLDKFERRSFERPDPVEYQLVNGEWKIPSDGSKMKLSDTSSGAWQKIYTDSTGWFYDRNLRGGYVSVQFDSDEEKVMLVEAMRHSIMYVNGEPHSGNVYQYKDEYESWEPKFNFYLIPVKMNKGINELLFKCYYGALKVKLHEVIKEKMLNPNGLTLPDIRMNDDSELFGGITVINNSGDVVNNLSIVTSGKGFAERSIAVPSIEPYTIKKVRFNFQPMKQDTRKKLILNLKLVDEKSNLVDKLNIAFEVQNLEETYKRTFISSIDNSVQYFAVNPPSDVNKVEPSALFLSLHGAGVEAVNQAGSYYHKNWGMVIAPTNRGPYGFNWEDWGRLDALEVYDIILKNYNIDVERIYLTGHSMGGHGTWHVGELYPDKFAAIAPSAGWISIWNYRYSKDLSGSSEVIKLLNRTGNQSRTLDMVNNYDQLGIYILHGDNDESVSVEEARKMNDTLSKFHKDFVYHEEPEATHWWDNDSDKPGADCVDWQPMFDFFAKHSRPTKNRIRHINFITANPGVSATNNWVTIYSQEKFMQFSKVDVTHSPGQNMISGTTENISILGIDSEILDMKSPLTIILDETKIPGINITNSDGKIWLGRSDGGWKIIETPSVQEKGPHRYGTFKSAFVNNALLVYGTTGSLEENNWSMAKARYDAEQFWYQANGSFDIVSDEEFLSGNFTNRNVILYGNSKTNRAWDSLTENVPVNVSNGKIEIGDKVIEKDGLACLFVYPMNGTTNNSVGFVSGTSLAGMKLTNTLPYLTAGIAYPDVTIISPNILKGGEDGYIGTGFFGGDWQVDSGEFILIK